MRKKYAFLVALGVLFGQGACQELSATPRELYEESKKLDTYANYSIKEMKAHREEIWDLIGYLMDELSAKHTKRDGFTPEQKKEIMQRITAYKAAEKQAYSQALKK